MSAYSECYYRNEYYSLGGYWVFESLGNESSIVIDYSGGPCTSKRLPFRLVALLLTLDNFGRHQVGRVVKAPDIKSGLCLETWVRSRHLVII